MCRSSPRASGVRTHTMANSGVTTSAVIPTAKTIRAARVAHEGNRAVIACAVCGVQRGDQGASIMPLRLLVERQLEKLSDVQRLAIRGLGYLLATAESAGDDQGVVRRRTHRGQQRALATLYRDAVVIAFLEPERSRHAATTGIDHAVVHAQLLQQVDLVVESQHGLLMTVAAYQYLPLQPRDHEVRRFRGEKFRQQVCLCGETLGILVIRDEIRQFVAKHRYTARLQPDDAHPCLNLRPQCVQYLAQKTLGEPEHSVVVEWPPATQ